LTASEHAPQQASHLDQVFVARNGRAFVSAEQLAAGLGFDRLILGHNLVRLAMARVAERAAVAKKGATSCGVTLTSALQKALRVAYEPMNRRCAATGAPSPIPLRKTRPSGQNAKQFGT